MPSVLRSVAAFSVVSAFVALTAPGCSQQGQGERCDSAKNGDADCESDLTCVKRTQLLEGITDRCCPAEGRESDKRCARGVPTSGSGAAGESSSGAGAPAGGETTGSAGAPANGGAPGLGSDGGTPGLSSEGGTPGLGSEGGTPGSEGGAAPISAGGVGGAD